jgi:hypothetical protein
MSKLSLDAGAEWAGVDAKEELVDLRSRIRVLKAELQGYKESHDAHCPSAERVRSLEAALRQVRICYESDDGAWPEGLYGRVKALTSESETTVTHAHAFLNGRCACGELNTTALMEDSDRG